MESNDNQWHDFLLWDIQNDIDESKKAGLDTNKLSDGHHTFEELYDFRMMYNAVLFNEWAKEEFWTYDIEMIDESKGIVKSEARKEIGKYNVHKSVKHNDGSSSEGWFIVCAMLPSGLISNHYKMEHWDLFQILETEKALFEYDGHTGQDTLKRLKLL